MLQPLISICIPTFNRARFISECLESIASQFFDAEVRSSINVFILDNQSEDNTELVVRHYTDKYSNIHYIKDSQKRKISPGIIKAATYADGEYIWIFSDDDIFLSGSLKMIIENLTSEKPEVVFCNMHGFVGANEVKYLNLLDVTEDIVLNNRREFFYFLNKKFFNTIDYYTTFCSNWLLKKEIFYHNYYIFEQYNSALDVFPFPSLVFYSKKDFSAKVIAQPILLFREDNASWSLKNEIKQFFYHDKLWRYHYKNIVNSNRSVLPRSFVFKVFLKNIFRKINLPTLLLIIMLKKLCLYNLVKNVYHKFKLFFYF